MYWKDGSTFIYLNLYILEIYVYINAYIYIFPFTGKPMNIYLYICMYVCMYIPWRRKWKPTPAFLPGKSHWQEAGRLQSMRLQRVGHDGPTNTFTTFSRPFPLWLTTGHYSLCSTVESGCWATKYIAMVVVQLLGHVWLLRPLDCSPPGSSVPGILQGRTLQWVTISFSILCRVVWTTLFLKLK